MRLKISIALIFCTFVTFSQKLERNVFQYETLKKDTYLKCDENTNKELESSYIRIQENNSAEAVNIAKQIYDKNNDCFETFETYGYALFRSGQWFEGIAIIEKGIIKFGSVPELIKRKSFMSLEMAELGTGQKNIDGNGVYKANALSYDEAQFKDENFKSALIDLEYLVANYKRNEDLFYVAKIHQNLKNLDKSTEIFKQLLNDNEYKNASIFNIADNYLAQNKLPEAESELNKLLAENPKEGQILNKLAALYEQQKDKEKAREYKNKALFYNNIPEFSNLEYSKDNFDLLMFFGTEDNNSDKKLKKLNGIFKQNNQDDTIDTCLMILKLHTNHGNGIEDRATEILATIGKPAIEKVNHLFQTDVSTCTISNLAEVMAKVKEESSWELMKTYLSYQANMPSTLLPPSVPEKMILFDEDRGITAILTVVRPLLNQADDLAALGQYAYYYPLEKINKKKLRSIANQLNYSDEEFKLLENKIK
jgi:tetratricopeptide (TPR) repeat protein